MNSVVGIDISKGESECFIFLDRNKPFGKSFRIQHTHLDIQNLILKLQEVEVIAQSKPCIVMEATGHYHLNLVSVLQKYGYEVIILNPLIPQRARKSKLRKV